MPVPKPRSGENKDDFISRCASEMADQDPNKPNNQRLAMCYTSWRENKENTMRKNDTDVIEITKEFRIPKTDIILEKGDRISVVNESSKKSRKKESMLPSHMVKDYEMRANAERAAGGSVEIDYRLPSVAVELSDGSEFFFQEHEASDLLDEVPENINEEDYILAVAQGW